MELVRKKIPPSFDPMIYFFFSINVAAWIQHRSKSSLRFTKYLFWYNLLGIRKIFKWKSLHMTTKLRYIIQNYITGIYTIDMVFLSCGFQMKRYLTTDLDSSLFSEGRGESTLKFGAKWSSDDKWNEYNLKNTTDSLPDFSISPKTLISSVRTAVPERGSMAPNTQASWWLPRRIYRSV